MAVLRVRGDEHAADAAKDQDDPARLRGGPQRQAGGDVAGADAEQGGRDQPAVGHALGRQRADTSRYRIKWDRLEIGRSCPAAYQEYGREH
jgi:hypothetical protein